MNYLTKKEQTVLCVVIALLLLGWTVKVYRAASTATVNVEVKP